MLDLQKLTAYKQNYEKKKQNQVTQRILNKVSMIDLIQDKDTSLDVEFNINIKTHGVMAQQNSGRCWSFAGLNLLREKVIENCHLDSFELSGSYVAFYDKLERFHILLERLHFYKKDKRDVYDRYVSYLLETGITDGGFFTQFAHLIEKYGIVPKTVFPETFSSSNTYEVNQILSRLLRKYYLELEKSKNIDDLKNKYMEKAYFIIANVYGTPPLSFSFEYTDKDGNYHIDKNLTPKEFYEKYIGMNLNDYIEIISYKDEKINFNNVYIEEESSRISDQEDNLILNLPSNEMLSLILKQLKSNEPVYFYCSTTSKRIDGIWMDVMERYGEIFGIDLTMDQNSILKTNGITNCHCMIFTGANVLDKKVTKWKIENSWGNKFGKNGYYVATNDWVEKYVHRIVIHKKFLNAKQKEILNQKAILLTKWDAKF